MHQVLAIINIQLHIQASYYDNQNNRGRDEKKQFQLHIQASYYDNQNNRGRDEKKQFRGNEGITLSTGLKCFRMWIQPVRVFTRFSQTFHEVEMPTRSLYKSSI
jgi:hypothetical protein